MYFVDSWTNKHSQRLYCAIRQQWLNHRAWKTGILVSPIYNGCLFHASAAEFTFVDNYIYDYHHLNLGNNKGRGVIMLTDKRLRAQEVSFGEEFDENLFVEITLNDNDKLLVGQIYRSDSGSSENNAQLLDKINLICNQNYSHLLTMGDFNLPKINWDIPHFGNHSEYEQQFLKCIQENYLFQYVNKPTRCRGKDTPHIPDLILSNDLNISQLEYHSPLGKSDHSVLVFNYHCYAELRDRKDIRYIWQNWLWGLKQQH